MVIFNDDNNDNEKTLSTEAIEELIKFKETLSTEGLVNVNSVKRLQGKIGEADEKLAKVKLNRFTEHLTKSGVAYIMDIVDTILQKQNAYENKTGDDDKNDDIENHIESIRLLNKLKRVLNNIKVKEPDDLINDSILVKITDDYKVIKYKDTSFYDLASENFDMSRIITEDGKEYIRRNNLIVSTVIAYLLSYDLVNAIITPSTLYKIIVNKDKLIKKINEDIKYYRNEVNDYFNSELETWVVDRPLSITETDIKHLDMILNNLVI